jgi:hypothetical protein
MAPWLVESTESGRSNKNMVGRWLYGRCTEIRLRHASLYNDRVCWWVGRTPCRYAVRHSAFIASNQQTSAASEECLLLIGTAGHVDVKGAEDAAVPEPQRRQPHTSGDSFALFTGLRNTTTPTPTRGSSGYALLLPLPLLLGALGTVLVTPDGVGAAGPSCAAAAVAQGLLAAKRAMKL